MKWLKRLLLGLVLTLVLLLGIVWALVGTEGGVGWLLQQAQERVPGLQVAQARGHLLDRLELEGLRYADEHLEAQVDHLVFDWRPKALFESLLHLRALTLEGVRYRALQVPQETKEEEKPTDEPLQLPDLQLPLAVRLDEVALTDVELITAPGAEPLRIDQARLGATWQADGIHLKELALQLPQGELEAAGRLRPQGDYPLSLDLQWRLAAAELPKVAGQGRIEGDLKRLHIEQALSGELLGRLQAELKDLLQGPAWQAKLGLSRLPTQGLPVALPETLQIDLDSRGDLKQAHLNLHLRGVPQPELESRPMTLRLGGDLAIETLRFDLDGQWQRLQWPLVGEPQVFAEAGRLSLKGSADDYRFTLDTALDGAELPKGQWQIAGRGGQTWVELQKLLGKTLGGLIQAHGKVGWKNRPTWDITLDARGIDPAGLRPDWPGKLDLALASRGRQLDQGIEMETTIERLQGELRGKPVAGRGRIQMQGQTLKVHDLDLSSGSARLTANGELGRQWHLDWKLAVPTLGDLLPDAQGSIQGQGKLAGSAEKPQVAGTLAVRDLAWQAYRIERTDADFDLALDDTFDNRLSLTGQGLDLAGQLVETLKLTLDGPLKDHRLQLAADHPQAKVTLAARGAYALDQAQWQGRLEKLRLINPDFGDWRLAAPAPLRLSAQAQRVDDLCLADGKARLCIQADRREKGGDARVTLNDFGLERLRDLLPPEIERLTGVVTAQVRANLAQPLTADLELDLSPGTFSYLDPQGRRIDLDHRDGKVEARFDAKALQADWGLRLGPHRLAGRLAVPRAALERDPKQAPLDGRVEAAITDLDLVRAFVPDIEELDGRVDVNLKLAGTLGDPALLGHARLDAKRLLVPRAGLDVRDIQVEARGTDGRHLTLKGQMQSGQGRLDLDGKVTLDGARGWPAWVTLRGERFQVVNLPEAQVVIDTDLRLDNTKEKTKIRGSLDLPKAIIQINDLPAGSQDVSSDAIVVGEEEPEPKGTNKRLDAEVVVTLGDEVHFSGFGLNVDLGGRLTVRVKDGKLPTANGELKILHGSFRAYGQDLTIEKGRISWAGGLISNPNLRLQASRRIRDTTVGVRVVGTAKKPQFSVYSDDPDLTEKEALSLLLTGQKGDDLSKASIYAGRQITPKLSVGVNMGADGGSEFVTRYRWKDHIMLEGTSSAEKSGASINYTFEIE